jgi:hypothetical protein
MHVRIGGFCDNNLNVIRLSAVVGLNCYDITWCSCLHFSFIRALQMNTNTCMMLIVHVQLVYLVQHWKCRVIWMVEGKYTPVMCVVSHSNGRVLWGYMNAYIVESGHLIVICVIKHSYGSVIWRYISANILGSVHLNVMCVINLSHCVTLWRCINAHILEIVNLCVMSVISLSDGGMF